MTTDSSCFIRYLIAAFVLAFTSCSKPHNGIYPVSGLVTYQNSPASGAAIFFYRQDGSMPNEPAIMGIVKVNGEYELVHGSFGKGAPPGEYAVVIEWKDVKGPNKGGPRHGPDKLKGRYADPKHPRLHATIKAQRNKLAPFELTDG